MYSTKIKRVLHHFAILAFYIIASLLYVWPLLSDFSTHIPGGTGDELTVWWPFWYIPQALADPNLSIVYSNLQVFPDGFRLLYHSNSLIGCLLMAPISISVSAAAALNTWIIIQLSLGGYFFFNLCRKYDSTVVAAIVGGLLFGFSSYVAAHIGGHYTLVHIAWPAGALLAFSNLVRPWTNENNVFGSRILWGFMLGVFVWLTTVSDFYLCIMTVFLLTLFLGGSLLVAPRLPLSKSFWLGLGSGILTTGILLLPWIFELRRSNAAKDYTSVFPEAGSNITASLASTMFPPSGHFIYSIFPLLLTLKKESNILESTYISLGSLLLIPLVFAVPAPRRKLALVLIIGLGLASMFAIGNSYTGSYDGAKALLFGRFWPRDGLLQQFRVPSRWHFAIVTIIAFLASQGLTALFSFKRKYYAIGWTLILLAVTDLYIGKIPTTSTRPDKWFLEKELSADGTLLSFPVGVASGSGGGVGQFHGNQIVDQTAHKHPILSGYLARLSNDILVDRKADLEFMALLDLQNGAPMPTQELDWNRFLKKYDIKYVQLTANLYGSPLETLVRSRFNVTNSVAADHFTLYTLSN